jgi:hypothetical protein
MPADRQLLNFSRHVSSGNERTFAELLESGLIIWQWDIFHRIVSLMIQGSRKWEAFGRIV